MELKEVKSKIIKECTTLYLDYTASGQGFKDIEHYLLNVLKTYANTHSKHSKNSKITTNEYKKARDRIKDALCIDNSFYTIPCGNGSTGAIKKFQELRGLYLPPATQKRLKIEVENRPLVVLGAYEHHSNEVSFKQSLCDTIITPLNKEGSIDLDALRQILEKNKNKTIIASFSVASNVTGIITPIKEIRKLVKGYGGIMCVDCATSSPHFNVDRKDYDVMFLSPHKLLGGVGSCGLLVIKKNLCNLIDPPTFAGGGTLSYVSKDQYKFLYDIEEKEDAGTPQILGFIKASLAYELRNAVGLEFIKESEEELKDYFFTKAKSVDKLTLYAKNNTNRLPIFALNIEGLHYDKLTKILSYEYNIETRSGCSCAGPYGHTLLNFKEDIKGVKKPGWVRVSLNYTHTKEDIDYLFECLKAIINTHCNR